VDGELAAALAGPVEQSCMEERLMMTALPGRQVPPKTCPQRPDQRTNTRTPPDARKDLIAGLHHQRALDPANTVALRDEATRTLGKIADQDLQLTSRILFSSRTGSSARGSSQASRAGRCRNCLRKRLADHAIDVQETRALTAARSPSASPTRVAARARGQHERGHISRRQVTQVEPAGLPMTQPCAPPLPKPIAPFGLTWSAPQHRRLSADRHGGPGVERRPAPPAPADPVRHRRRRDPASTGIPLSRAG